MSKIREQPIGSTAIDGASYNAIARSARAFENLTFDQEQFDVQRDLTGMYVALQEQPVDDCGRGIIRKSDSLEVTVTAIDWTRNGLKVNAAETVVAVPDGATSFIIMKLTTTNTNPSVNPLFLVITAAATIDDLVGGSGFEGTVFVLGTVTAASGDITDVTQLWCGGDVDDKWVVPDGQGNAAGTNKATTLFRRQPGDDNENVGELEMHDASQAVRDGSGYVTQLTGATVVAVPVMNARGAGGAKTGILTWVIPTPVILTNFTIVTDVFDDAGTLKKKTRLITVNAGIWESIGSEVTSTV